MRSKHFTRHFRQITTGSLLLVVLLLSMAPAHAESELLNIEGTGPTQTRPVEAKGPWEIRWLIRCADEAFCSGRIFIKSIDGTLLKAIDDLIMGEPGRYYYPTAGNYLFEVDGVRPVWSIQVIQVGD